MASLRKSCNDKDDGVFRWDKSWNNLIELYEAWSKAEKAEEWREVDNWLFTIVDLLLAEGQVFCLGYQ